MDRTAPNRTAAVMSDQRLIADYPCKRISTATKQPTPDNTLSFYQCRARDTSVASAKGNHARSCFLPDTVLSVSAETTRRRQGSDRQSCCLSGESYCCAGQRRFTTLLLLFSQTTRQCRISPWRQGSFTMAVAYDETANGAEMVIVDDDPSPYSPWFFGIFRNLTNFGLGLSSASLRRWQRDPHKPWNRRLSGSSIRLRYLSDGVGNERCVLFRTLRS